MTLKNLSNILRMNQRGEEIKNFLVPSAFAKKLYETKNKKKNDKLVEEIKNRQSNLKDEVEKNA